MSGLGSLLTLFWPDLFTETEGAGYHLSEVSEHALVKASAVAQRAASDPSRANGKRLGYLHVLICC